MVRVLTLMLIFFVETKLDVGNLIYMNILQDGQARLVFRAQTYIRTELEQFQPTAEDLNYPQCLSMYLINFTYS